MTSNNSFIPGAIAGAIAGAAVTVILLQNPAWQEKINIDTDRGSTQSALPDSASKSPHERAVIETVQAAQPAVVSIVITQDVPIIEQYFEEAPSPLNPFGDFFGSNNPLSPFSFRVPRFRENGTEKREVGGGSGFIVSADGLIITNRHVVSQAEADYTVFLSDGAKQAAKVIARDPVNDVAVLKIEASNLPFLEFSDSSQLQVGQTTIAIGNALGEFRNSVSTGVVSGLARSISAGNGQGVSEQLDEVIQTDAAINPGNSGGPLLDLTGKVIGVNVAVVLGSENIGFALPANLVKSIVDSVRETGKISRPYIGIRYVPITPALKESNKLAVDYGVLISRGATPEELAVVPGSPANRASLTEGDIILEIDGQRLDENKSLAQIIRNKKVGDTIKLKVLSKGQEKEVNLTLDEFPGE